MITHQGGYHKRDHSDNKALYCEKGKSVEGIGQALQSVETEKSAGNDDAVAEAPDDSSLESGGAQRFKREEPEAPIYLTLTARVLPSDVTDHS